MFTSWVSIAFRNGENLTHLIKIIMVMGILVKNLSNTPKRFLQSHEAEVQMF